MKKFNQKFGFTLQNFSKKNLKGFTLIELLVVIAIIGLLASIVYVSLGGARTKAKDARIIVNMTQIREIAELAYTGAVYPDGTSNNNDGFDTPIYTGGTAPACTGDVTRRADLKMLGGDIRSQQGMLCTTAAAANTGSKVGVFIVKNTTDTVYAAYVGLLGINPSGWCVDSTGVSRAYTLTAGNPTATTCP